MSEVIDNYKKIIRMHLDKGIYTAIASHDDRIISWVKDYARANASRRMPLNSKCFTACG